MTIPKVVYGRRSKEYRIIDDDGVIVGSFPPGQKHQAKKRAIALANIRLDDILQKQLLRKRPYLAKRAYLAAELVLEGKVTPSEGDPVYFAYVDGAGDVYGLSFQAGLVACTCYDFTSWQAPIINLAGQRACKHYLAWTLFQRMQRRRCQNCQQLALGRGRDLPTLRRTSNTILRGKCDDKRQRFNGS